MGKTTDIFYIKVQYFPTGCVAEYHVKGLFKSQELVEYFHNHKDLRLLESYQVPFILSTVHQIKTDAESMVL